MTRLHQDAADAALRRASWYTTNLKALLKGYYRKLRGINAITATGIVHWFMY